MMLAAAMAFFFAKLFGSLVIFLLPILMLRKFLIQ